MGPAALLISAFGYVMSGLITVINGLKVAFVAMNGVVLANPWALLAAGVIAAGAWLIHFVKKSQEASIANDKFNTTLINVNGSLKKMKDLTSIDYSSMGIQALIDTQNTVKSQLAQINKDVANAYNNAGVTPDEAAMGKSAGKYTRYIDIKLSEGLKLKNQYNEIGQQIVKWGDNFGKAGAIVNETNKAIDAQSDAVDKLGKAWQESGNFINDAWNLIKKGMNKDFWTMMIPPKKENLLTGYLGAGRMQRSGQGNGFGFMDQLTPALSSIKPSGFMPSMKGEYSATASVMETLRKELEFITIKEDALGISIGKHRQLFDSARAKVSAYSKALEDYLLIPVTERGASWQKEVNNTVDSLERMQKEFDKIQTRRDFLNGITDTFSSFFMNIMQGTKSVSAAFKEMVGSIVQSFEKMIADMLAKKVATFLMNLLFPGGGTAMSVAGKAAGAVGLNMFGFANGTNYAPGGWSWVGEKGPELMNVPKGAQILSNNLSNLAMQPAVIQGDVRFVIEDNQLVGILRKANKRNNLT
jgi:hypothetical protein